MECFDSPLLLTTPTWEKGGLQARSRKNDGFISGSKTSRGGRYREYIRKIREAAAAFTFALAPKREEVLKTRLFSHHPLLRFSGDR